MSLFFCETPSTEPDGPLNYDILHTLEGPSLTGWSTTLPSCEDQVGLDGGSHSLAVLRVPPKNMALRRTHNSQIALGQLPCF